MPETGWGQKNREKDRWAGGRTGSAFYWAMMVALFYSPIVAGAAKSVPMEPGQLDISATVVVVFELK